MRAAVGQHGQRAGGQVQRCQAVQRVQRAQRTQRGQRVAARVQLAQGGQRLQTCRLAMSAQAACSMVGKKRTARASGADTLWRMPCYLRDILRLGCFGVALGL